MTQGQMIQESAGAVPIVATSDVVVVGGGPAGFAAAIAARREGCSVTLIERYPYLGGLASGGMVLVLDDMNNGYEVTVTGLCMEMIDRMARAGTCVFPPKEDQRQGWDTYKRWAPWGLFDFRSSSKPMPIVMAAAFDPDGWKRASNEMISDAGVSAGSTRTRPSVSATRSLTRLPRLTGRRSASLAGRGTGGG